MKKILLAALVASTMFSCNNGEIDGVGNQEDQNSVFITLNQPDLTKGITPEKDNTKHALIGSARIFFLDASNIKVYQRELSNAEIALIVNTETTPGNKTIEITGIPNSAVRLYFLANVKTTDGGSYPEVTGDTSETRLRMDDLQGDAVYIPMSGLSTDFLETTTNSYTTSVDITPVVSRVEVGQLTCENALTPPSTSDIVSYKLSGVFINHARTHVLVSGGPYTTESPIDIQNQAIWSDPGTGWEAYFAGNVNFPYFTGGTFAVPTGWMANTFVDYCTPDNAALSFYPDLTNGATDVAPATPIDAWAYQVCPTSIDNDLPHLIFKLTEVEYVNNPLAPTTQYITVSKYLDNANQPVTEFKPGHVYRIDNLVFTHDNTTPKPYEENITVTATVTVIPWEVNLISPDWN
jgi:hypothetical protein